MSAALKLLGVGSPLLDLLCRIPETFLAEHVSGAKGGMENVTPEEQDQILSQLNGNFHRAPGGSAGNTVFTLARLGMPVAMLGRTGQDPEGEFYQQKFSSLGGDCRWFDTTAQDRTGRCLSLITPDGERTMRSFLGAAATIGPEAAGKVDFSLYDIVYIEGYQLFSGEFFSTVLQRAKAANCRIGLDLASFEVAGIFRNQLLQQLSEYVDIVLANEEEARALLGDLPEAALLEELSRLCSIAVLKLGSRGALIAADGQTFTIPANLVEALDTTAAGDTWAAGFFYGMMTGKPWDVCGRYGALLSSEVVQVIGSEIPEDRWKLLLEKL